MKNSPFCYYPYTNLTVESGGIIRLCCATESHVGHLSEIEDIYQFWLTSPIINSIRNQMETGYQPLDKSICFNCTRNENLGLVSQRINYNKRFNSFNFENKLEIKDMDISFSRSCNLQCATCNSKFSSKWFNDDRKRVKINPTSYFQKLSSFIGVNPAMSNNHLEQLIKIAANVKRITVKGGEPFLEKRFKYFISKIENKQFKKFVCVTNGTIYDISIVNEIKKFKNYLIVLSIDGVASVHKWIRNCNDEQYLNIYKLGSDFNEVHINTVVSAFNIFTLDLLIDELLTQNKFKIARISLTSVTKAIDQSFLIFDKKYYSQMINVLEKAREIALIKGKDIVSIEEINLIIEYINSNRASFKYSLFYNKKLFLENYENILEPSRGYCLSTVDPLFKQALEDLKNECKS